MRVEDRRGVGAELGLVLREQVRIAGSELGEVRAGQEEPLHVGTSGLDEVGVEDAVRAGELDVLEACDIRRQSGIGKARKERRVIGAGRGQSFLYITLPLVGPWLLLLTLRDIVMTAQNVFVAAYIMTQGGPYYATTFVPLLVHEEAFDRLRFGDAAAMMVIVYAAVALLLLLAVLAIRLGHYETEKD